MDHESRLFVVDKTECNRCGLCVKDCPARIIELDTSAYPKVRAERETECVRCQHCLAICPGGAVSIAGLRPEDSPSYASEALPTFEQMDGLVRFRRSVRQYRQSNVEPTLVTRILDALAHAPTGVNARQLTFTVIQDRQAMEALRTKVYDAITVAAELGQLPQRAEFLAKFAHSWRTEQRDVIFRGAPHLLVVSAPSTTPCPQQDVVLTLAYFELLSQSVGLGTVWFGFLKVVLEALPALKVLFGLAPDDVYYGMLFGESAVKYARSVQRAGSAQVRILSTFA
jgi:Fe-S-cluster-containing hydrogenase component 2